MYLMSSDKHNQGTIAVDIKGHTIINLVFPQKSTIFSNNDIHSSKFCSRTYLEYQFCLQCRQLYSHIWCNVFWEKKCTANQGLYWSTKKKNLCTCLYIWMAATQKTFPRINTFGLVMVISRILLYFLLQLFLQMCIIFPESFWVWLIIPNRWRSINYVPLFAM